MKPHPCSLLLAAALAGCISEPFEVREGPKSHYTSTQSPRSVVECMTRNQASNGFALTPSVKEGEKGELFYSLRASNDDVHLYVELVPLGVGSTLTVLTMSIPIRDRIEAAVMKGC